MQKRKLLIGAAIFEIGVLATIASCIYLVVLGFKADASGLGGDGISGWWQLIVSVLFSLAGLIYILKNLHDK